jgi:endonuclease YncB( thermonuclease family)
MQWLFLLIILFSVTPAAAQSHVVDGDSLVIEGSRVRLYGIDAPEHDQTCPGVDSPRFCGQEAKQHLTALLIEPLACENRGTDRYKRALMRCFNAKGQDIAAEMVLNGWAMAYERYSSIYVSQQKEAQSAKRGFWAYGFPNPESYRREAKCRKILSNPHS